MTPLDRGLEREEAVRRLAEGGQNVLAAQERTPPWRQVLAQIRSPLVLILIAAVVVAALMGDLPDAFAIAVIVTLNAVIGFVQERRAEEAMAALRSMTAPRAAVRRGGQLLTIPAAEVVVGDLLVLSPGDVVAADARVREVHALACNEAALTGESLPVRKQVEAVTGTGPTPLAERHDMVFMGTAVAGGSGLAEVTAIGMATEIGRIAALLAAAGNEPTPLQKRLDRVGRLLLIICVSLVAVVTTLGFFRGMSWEELFLSSVSMAVAAVPEGMPAIITIALALGMQRMAARRVLVRRLAAVETLGSVTVICTDKTGTLTTGIMSVRALWGPDEQAILWAAVACCDAELAETGEGGEGDTTELAILRAAREHGIERSRIEREHPRLRVLPFSTESRSMSVRRRGADEGAPERVWVKGAVEVLAARAGPDSALGAQEIEAAAARLGADGLRVLAVGVGDGEDDGPLSLLGLIGLADPPRPAAREAIAAARSAGVRTMMITGDHPVTAHAIARELGLFADGVGDGMVRARATAEDKTRIVAELRATGEVVAMTGDGVNDSPAIREADVGLAMGETATEVTREASDMILVDEDLSSVVTAIREGRVIYDNIQKTVVYLLSGNFSELAIMLLAAALGMPFPLLPLQLLWINLMTEPLPGVALVIDPPDDDVLRHPPRDPAEPLLHRRAWALIVAVMLLQTVVSFGVYYWALELEGRPLHEARSLAFSVVVCSEVLRAFAFRSPTRLLWQVGALRNLWLVGVVVLSLLMQLGLYQLAFTRELFSLGRLSWADMGLGLALGFIPVSVLEISKLIRALILRLRGRS
ncbi:MAG: cation-translocating P-type ATPase [Myxococcales bacterium]|nr:cation-translocating P-type ATPase [Myxococcales bacterium]